MLFLVALGFDRVLNSHPIMMQSKITFSVTKFYKLYLTIKFILIHLLIETDGLGIDQAQSIFFSERYLAWE